MSVAQLRRLESLLARAVELAARERLPRGTLDDYAHARDLVHKLVLRVPSLSASERERVELNADLPQLTFHLAEELDAGAADRESLLQSLTFLRRHLIRLQAEYAEGARTRLDPVDLELVMGLARLTRAVYERRFAVQYAEYRRPFVDKLYRDYALCGLPDALLLELADLAARDENDAVLCVLKGGLPYTLLLELCGLPPERVGYVVCGRASGSHLDAAYTLRPIDFELADLEGRSVLVVDNNAATGATLARLTDALRDARPARIALFLDYILTEVAGLDRAGLERMGFAEVRTGPFAPRPGDVEGLKRRLVTDLAVATGSLV
jgi:phosphoribosyl transferase-like protein